MTPVSILGFFAAIMVIVAVLGAYRLAAAAASARLAPGTDVDVAHVAMGMAMAGMLASGLRMLPNGIWVTVFALLTAWFGWRVAAETHGGRIGTMIISQHAPHLIHSAAMVYMFAARTVPGAGSGHGPGPATGMASAMGGGAGILSAPTVGLAFVLIMAAWAVWDLDQLTGSRRYDGGREAQPVIPVALSERVALGAAGTMPSQAGLAPADNGAAVTTAVTRNSAGAPGGAVTRLPVAVRALRDPRAAILSRIAISVTMALTLVMML